MSAQVDPTFNPVPTNISSFSGGFTVQPDGKIIIYGDFQIVQGVQKSGIARLNADGSLDNSFDCAACDFSIGSAVVESNGKIVVGGFKATGNSIANRLRRLNADGSIDNSFASPFAEQPDGFNPSSKVWAIQPDGKIFVSQHFSFMGDPWSYLYRLNQTGSIDNSFARLYFNYGIGQFGAKNTLLDLKLLPDGKLIIGGKHEFGFLFRVNTDGTNDTSFVSPVLTNTFQGLVPFVNSFDIQADGKIPFVGSFSSINGISKEGFARLGADQSVETSYTFPLSYESNALSVRKLQLQSDGKLLVTGPFTGGKRIVRLNADGGLDNSFNAPANLTEISFWKLDASDRILVTGTFTGEGTKLARLNTDGSRDTTFNILFGVPPNTIYSTAVQPDGKILFSGGFRLVNNVARRSIARLNADGSLDSAFNPGNGFNRDVYQLVPQTDGKILAVGIFEFYNGTPRNGFARINADGSLDTAFDPTINNYVAVTALQADGKILIGGGFTTVNGTARTGLARLNTDGSLDNSFNPTLTNDGVFTILIQPDGKIMVGGRFSTVNGSNRQNLARLNPDSSLDTSFNAGSVPGDLRIIERQPDGKYLTSDRNTIVRRNADGSTDTSFQSINFDNQFSIRAIVPQTDGTILVGGGFTRVGNDLTKAYLVRLAANGSLQTDFLPGGVNARVWTLSKQADNKVIVGGEFTSIGGTTRFGIARLNYSPAVRAALYDFDGDGKADVSVFRPSENKWYILQSSNSAIVEKAFAVAGDIPAPADYDGDGKTDIAIFRPGSGDWWYAASSASGQHRAVRWGQAGDIPRPSDFDGDGKTDFIVYRPSNSVWYRFGSTGATSILAFGISEDKPLTGDFDGDGKSDPAVFRPSTGVWWYAASSANGQHRGARWGISTDVPTPGDYDGDGKSDYAVFRPSNGGWYILYATGNYTITAFGISEDKPVPADYDGDGKADIAVFRPSTSTWYLRRTTAGFSAVQWGIATDIPTQNAFNP